MTERATPKMIKATQAATIVNRSNRKKGIKIAVAVMSSSQRYRGEKG